MCFRPYRPKFFGRCNRKHIYYFVWPNSNILKHYVQNDCDCHDFVALNSKNSHWKKGFFANSNICTLSLATC